DAVARLEREVSTYLQMPQYARHFQAMGAQPASVGVAAAGPSDLAEAVQRYAALDEPVVRVLSHRTMSDILAVGRAAVGA
ncbi:MAG TPA: hypothetical protein VGR61_00640, partial [Candidatus Dormibacteraeota bacterium]|nr:hypothetical protein [Candidatus Dormibacteraeota bacterium]